VKISLNTYNTERHKKIIFYILYNMNSTRNNSFQKAALKVFSDLYDLIKEDKNIKINEIRNFSIFF
jgi:hypothetical protein